MLAGVEVDRDPTVNLGTCFAKWTIGSCLLWNLKSFWMQTIELRGHFEVPERVWSEVLTTKKSFSRDHCQVYTHHAKKEYASDSSKNHENLEAAQKSLLVCAKASLAQLDKY
ncbi:Hypothetical predicted protein [Olea europaea subsp. europaea]|uniref:Uncharacterized protein n=1 Tax=Olea europaea subsp. europaea TaxID=158383 RepID=A0A8S0V1M2_OLEEU|nr:Hypothetical predicted protein [Olea europaea subsp. europaea]